MQESCQVRRVGIDALTHCNNGLISEGILTKSGDVKKSDSLAGIWRKTCKDFRQVAAKSQDTRPRLCPKARLQIVSYPQGRRSAVAAVTNLVNSGRAARRCPILAEEALSDQAAALPRRRRA